MTPQYPQTTEELQRMLRAGMGRAILFLLSQDLSKYHDLILDLCLHNYVYDKQFEESRVQYLYPLIEASGEEERYRQEIAKALPDTKEYFDAMQILDFAVLFARDGDETARQAIYEKILLNNTDEVLTGEDQAIELDGIRGLLFVMDIVGSDPKLLDQYKDDYIIRDAEKVSSVEELRQALKQAALENPNIAAALANMKDYSPDWTAEEIVQRREQKIEAAINAGCISENATWEEVKNHPKFRTIISRWAYNAPEDEFIKAAQDLEIDEDPEKLRFHLRAFWKRKFPLDPSHLLPLVDHPDERVQNAALRSLEIIRHDEIRKLYQRLINDPKLSYDSLGLLRSNYQSGDDKTILAVLQNENDPDNLHGIGVDVMHVYRDNPFPEGLQPLFLVYEKDPCSVCRRTCIERIQGITELPDWMIEECLYDAESETRELAVDSRLRE